MFETSHLLGAYELGKTAGGIQQAQVAECPYQHSAGAERQAWLDGFSAGRMKLQADNKAGAAGSLGGHFERARRATPFGSRVVYHFSTKTIAVDFLDQLKVLGPFEDEDTAYQAAFAFVETRRALLDMR